MLKQQYAVTQQSAGVRTTNFPDSLSQYSKHSDELGAVSDLTNILPAITRGLHLSPYWTTTGNHWLGYT